MGCTVEGLWGELQEGRQGEDRWGCRGWGGRLLEAGEKRGEGSGSA